MNRYSLIALGLAVSVSGYGQVGAPLLGYVPDGPKIRAAYGMPSSSTVTRALNAGADFTRLTVSPDQQYILGSSDTGDVSLYRPLIGQAVPLAGAGRAPGMIAISPRGSAAALWFASTGRIQVFTGLPENAQRREIETAFLGRAPRDLAVSDDGKLIAGAWAAGLYAFGSSGEYQWLPLSDTRALAFFNGSHDLAAVSPQGVHRVLDFGGRSELRRLFDTGDAPLQIRGVAVSADNRQLVTVDVNGQVTSTDAESGVSSSSNCHCSPTGVFRMNRTAFRLTGLQDGAYKLFDSATGEVLYAPVAAEEADAK